MRIWVDTEFNGFLGPLISMGLVAEDGSEFYEALYCGNPNRWVAENVIPNLGTIPVSLEVFRTKLQRYLSQFSSIHIVADWPEDLAHFCRSLTVDHGFAIVTPPLTMELRRDIHGYSKVPHNALEDARANMLEHIERELNPK